MNVALFGGTFDPVHRGHIVLAQEAQKQHELKQVHFIPAYVPPHKAQPSTAFEHRYAMLALATQDEKAFLPSLLESPSAASPSAHDSGTAAKAKRRSETAAKSGDQHQGAAGANYSVDTVRRFKRTLGKSDRLFFLIGIDAFLEIATWKDSEALLAECEFIVGSRPGYTLADVANALPFGIRPSAHVTKPFRHQPAKGELVLGPARIHLLEGVNVPVSATQVRQAAAHGKSLTKYVHPAVAGYIKKMRLYLGES